MTMFGVTTPCVTRSRKPGGEVRLPRLPRHRHRRPGDGEARRVRPDRRRRSTSRRPRWPTKSSAAYSAGPRSGFDAIRAPACPSGSCGALDMVNFGARTRCPNSSGRRLHVHNSQRDVDADDGRENRAIALGSPASSTVDGPVRSHPGKRRLGDRRARASRSTTRRPTRRCSKRSAALSRRTPSRKLVAPAAAHQRPGVRRRAGRRLRAARGDAPTRHQPARDHAPIARQTCSSASARRSPPASRSSAAARGRACPPSAKRPAGST